jgi:hypothetical protein
MAPRTHFYCVHERHIFCKLERSLSAVNSWCEHWNIKINEGKPQAIYFSTRLRVHNDVLQLIEQDIPFVSNVTFLHVPFDRRMTWRYHIERTVAMALHIYIRAYSLFRSGRLSTNIKPVLCKALIRSVMTYACPT